MIYLISIKPLKLMSNLWSNALPKKKKNTHRDQFWVTWRRRDLALFSSLVTLMNATFFWSHITHGRPGLKLFGKKKIKIYMSHLVHIIFYLTKFFLVVVVSVDTVSSMYLVHDGITLLFVFHYNHMWIAFYYVIEKKKC